MHPLATSFLKEETTCQALDQQFNVPCLSHDDVFLV